MNNKILPLIVSLGLIVYPLLIYFGLSVTGPAWLIVGLLLLMGMRSLVMPIRNRRVAVISLLGVVLLIGLVVFLAGEVIALRFYPVAVSVVLSATFAGSLFTKYPLVERIARLREPDLPKAAVRYTRRLTIVWAILIFLNGIVALWTALYASMAIWAIYNGLLSYLIFGTFFLLEWLYRERVVKQTARV